MHSNHRDGRSYELQSCTIFAAVVLSAAAACTVDPATGPSRPGDPFATNATVFHRPFDPNYIEESRRVLHGNRLGNGGCGVGSVDTMSVGQRVLEWVAEYDLSTCVLTLARGRYVGPQRASRNSPMRVQVDTAKQGGMARGWESLPSRRLAPARGPQVLFDITSDCDEVIESAFRAFQQLITEDPVQLDVNWDRIEYEWSSRPSLNCIQSAVMTHTAYWLVLTGWSITGFQTFVNYYSADRSYVQGSVGSNFSNLLFCNPVSYTYVNYDYNNIRAFADGHVVFEWYWSWTGDCASLLHADRIREVVGV